MIVSPKIRVNSISPGILLTVCLLLWIFVFLAVIAGSEAKLMGL